jgi:hypothetical protein
VTAIPAELAEKLNAALERAWRGGYQEAIDRLRAMAEHRTSDANVAMRLADILQLGMKR